MKTIKQRLKSAVDEARQLNDELYRKAEEDARALTDDERGQLDSALEKCRNLKAEDERRQTLDDFASTLGLDAPDGDSTEGAVLAGKFGEAQMQSLGARFTDSDQYKNAVKSGLFNADKWVMPTVQIEQDAWELAKARFKTTLTEAAGGASLIQPSVQAGIFPLLFRRLTIADLLPSAVTDAVLIRVIQEATFTNAAATVAEGAAKPESAITFSQVDETIQKIAHWIPVSDEMLEDIGQVRGLLDNRLTLGVQLTEEDQLLNGNGTPPNLRGLLNRSGLQTAQARGTDSNADAVFKQITNISVNAFYAADAIVINPANWQTIMLDKDANGQYRAGGPFSNPGVSTLWGVRVVVTPAIAAGTALVGSFAQAAQVYRKGGIALSASNSHQDYFIKNLTAIRAEERLGLGVWRPAAFGTVTGLN